jgi:hypothetical protein
MSKLSIAYDIKRKARGIPTTVAEDPDRDGMLSQMEHTENTPEWEPEDVEEQIPHPDVDDAAAKLHERIMGVIRKHMKI